MCMENRLASRFNTIHAYVKPCDSVIRFLKSGFHALSNTSASRLSSSFIENQLGECLLGTNRRCPFATGKRSSTIEQPPALLVARFRESHFQFFKKFHCDSAWRSMQLTMRNAIHLTARSRCVFLNRFHSSRIIKAAASSAFIKSIPDNLRQSFNRSIFSFQSPN